MTAVELDDDVALLVGQYRHARQAIKDWEQVAEGLKARIVAALATEDGYADEGHVAGEVAVAYQTVERTTLDAKQLRHAWPQVYDQYSRTTMHRRLVVV